MCLPMQIELTNVCNMIFLTELQPICLPGSHGKLFNSRHVWKSDYNVSDMSTLHLEGKSSALCVIVLEL